MAARFLDTAIFYAGMVGRCTILIRKEIDGWSFLSATLIQSLVPRRFIAVARLRVIAELRSRNPVELRRIGAQDPVLVLRGDFGEVLLDNRL